MGVVSICCPSLLYLWLHKCSTANFSPYFDNEAPKVLTLSATIDLTIDITKSFLTNRIIYLVIPINIARAIKMADVNAVFVR